MKLSRITAVVLIVAMCCVSLSVFATGEQRNYASRVTEVNTEGYTTGATELKDGGAYLIYTVSPTQSERKLLSTTLNGLKLAATIKSTFTFPKTFTETADWSGNLWTVEMVNEESKTFKLKNPDGKYLATSMQNNYFAALLADSYDEGHTFTIDKNGRLMSTDSNRYLASSTTKDVWFVPADATQTKYMVCFYSALNWVGESEAVGYSARIDGKKKDLAAVRFVFDCGLEDKDVEKSYIIYTDFSGFDGGNEEPIGDATKIVVSDNNGLGSFYGDVDEIDFLGTAYAMGCVKIGEKYYWSALTEQEITQLGEVEE